MTAPEFAEALRELVGLAVAGGLALPVVIEVMEVQIEVVLEKAVE